MSIHQAGEGEKKIRSPQNSMLIITVKNNVRCGRIKSTITRSLSKYNIDSFNILGKSIYWSLNN